MIKIVGNILGGGRGDDYFVRIVGESLAGRVGPKYCRWVVVRVALLTRCQGVRLR